MGASESKLAFKEDVFRLAREDNIPADHPQFWAQVGTASLSSRDGQQAAGGLHSNMRTRGREACGLANQVAHSSTSSQKRPTMSSLSGARPTYAISP